MLWLFLTALAVVAASPGEHIGKVLSSWDLSKPIDVIRLLDNSTRLSIPFEESATILAANPCQPGYTGPTCTNPICTRENPSIPAQPDGTGFISPIDSAVLSNCAQTYVLLIDERLTNIRVRVSSDLNVNPQFYLQDSNGKKIIENDIWEQTPNIYELIYFSLVPGPYTIVPKADVPITCQMQAQAHTEMTVVGGFTTGDRIMAERNDFPISYVTVGTKVSAVMHTNNNLSPGALQTIKFVGAQNTYYPSEDLRIRYGCGYEYFISNFECSVIGEHYFQVEGVTHKGNGFRRIVTFDCLPDIDTNVTVPSTTPGPSPTSCHNGGFHIKNLDGSSYCFCVGLFTGKDCSQRLCMNGGTAQTDNTCKCSSGYNGEHCEAILCMDIGGFGFEANHPTLTFVIRGRQQMNDVVNQVANAASTYVANMQFDPTYLQNFILIVFNNNKLILFQRYQDISKLLSDLGNAQKNFTSDGGCTDSLFSAISQALNMYPTNKSPMYVFTDATPSDSNMAETILNQLSHWRVPISIVYTPTTISCTLTPDDPNYRQMDRLSKKSMGAIYYMANTSNVNSFTYDHLFKTVYRSQMMLSNDLDSCSLQNPYQAITIENLIDELVIIGTGANLILVLTPPESDIPPMTIDPYYSDGQNFIWSFNRMTTGSWLISLNSTTPNGACSFKVYQKSLHSPSQNIQYDIFWAHTAAIDSDGPVFNPVYGVDMAISMHLTNYPLIIPPQYIQAGLNIYALRGGKQAEVYASNGIWRDGCDFNFYFPSFTCSVPDETLYFNFYARDQLGMAIQRAGVMNCMNYVPTPRPPSVCQNGGVMNPDNSTCWCPLGFTGTHCEKITCFNGGTPVGQQCQCTVGWTGPFCAQAQCLERGPDPEILVEGVDMVFAVELTEQSFAQLTYLNKVFPELLRDIVSQNRYWIRNFVLVGYNSTWGDVIYFTPSQFQAGIIAEMDKLASKPPTDKGCVVQLNRALNRAILRGTTPPGSFLEIFQTSPANPDGWGELYENMRALYLVAYGFLAITNPSIPVYPNGLYCNASFNDFQLLFDFTAGSSGKTYPIQSAFVQDVAYIIPMQYRSGFVWGQYGMDCTGVKPYQVYFPVDAYTQTILLTIVGNNSQVTVYDSNNNEVEPFRFMHDTVSLWDLYEIRKPCDTNWTEIEQYCTYFSQQKMTWNDAQSYCSKSGGFLVDDLTQDKHRFLGDKANSNSFWMGLRNPDGNGYVWDRGNNQPSALNQSNMWWVGGGGIPTYNAAKQCVFWDGTVKDQNTWTPDDCGAQRTFICQKHRYDQDSPPNSLNDALLPAGMWYVNISTSAPATVGYDGCYAEIRVQSNLQIYTGFVTNQIIDFPARDPINNSPNNRLITYVHSEDNENRVPLLKQAMFYDAYNGTFYNAAQYQYRFDCSFNWVSQTFPCPNGMSEMNEFVIAHVGEDEFGNMFQRVTLAHCSQATLVCGNGGFIYDGQCICNEYWTGTYCTTPICVNNGTLDPKNDKQCKCPTGYGGPNCQYDECLPRIPYNFTPDNRTLILMIEATTPMKTVFDQLSTNLVDILNNALQQDPNWFKNYVLVTFDTNDIIYSSYTYTTPQDLQTAIGSLSGALSPGSCTSNLYKYIRQTLMQRDQIAFPNSQILLITASSAADYQTRAATIETISDSEANLHWLYMSSATCGSIPSDPSMPHLVKLAYASNGNAVFINPQNITDFLTPYIASRFSAQVLDNPTFGSYNGTGQFDCTSGNYLVQVDANTTYLYITTNSQFGQVGIYTPNGQQVVPNILYSSGGQTQLYQVKINGMPGIYSIMLSSPGTCLISIWGVGSMNVFSRYASVKIGDPSGSHTDGLGTSPRINATTTAVFHLSGSPGHRGQLQYLEVADNTLGGTFLRSELYRRTECSFEYYSDPFICTDDKILTFYVYGIDENYQQFRRQQMAFCIDGPLPTNAPITPSTLPPTTTTAPPTTTSHTTTPTPPPTTSFGNRNLIFDIVILIDTSSSAKDLYDDMSSFITTLMSAYSVSQPGVRVAIITVLGGNPGISFAPYLLNSITSNNVLATALNSVKGDATMNGFKQPGDGLQAALSMAISSNFIQEGYRSTLTNHLILYVTTTSTLTDNPNSNPILTKGTYGIITVGYGAGITTPKSLQDISGGADCYFSSQTAADLSTTVVKSVQDKIWQANFNGGAYCGNPPAN